MRDLLPGGASFIMRDSLPWWVQSYIMRDWMQVLQYTAAPVVHFQNVDPLFYEAWYVGLLVLRQDRTILFLRISIQYTVFSFKTHLVIPSLSTNSFFSQDGSEPSNIVVKWWMVVELCSYAVSLPSLSSNLLSSWSAGSFFLILASSMTNHPHADHSPQQTQPPHNGLAW